jgi:hypothetical protein
LRHPWHGLAGREKEKTDLPARPEEFARRERGINGAQICQCGQWWPRSPIWEDNGAVPDPDKIVKMQIAPIRLPGRNRQGRPPVPPLICCLKVTKRNAVS